MLSLSHLPGGGSQLCQSDTVCLGGPGAKVSKRRMSIDILVVLPEKLARGGSPLRIDQGEFRSRHSNLVNFY